jgi:hypothetical protein
VAARVDVTCNRAACCRVTGRPARPEWAIQTYRPRPMPTYLGLARKAQSLTMAGSDDGEGADSTDRLIGGATASTSPPIREGQASSSGWSHLE